MLRKAVLCSMLICCLFQLLHMQMADAQEADVEVRFRALVALGTLVFPSISIPTIELVYQEMKLPS